MKKVIKVLSIFVLGLLVGATNLVADDFVDKDVELANFNYVYYPSQHLCHKNTFPEKRDFYDMFKNRKIILNKPYINGAGYYLQIAGEDKDGQFKMHFMDTYGECKFFEAVVIDNKENVDVNQFKNLKDPSIK